MTSAAATGVRAGRALAIEALTFDGFPSDDRLWWLRWVDYGAATGTSRSSFLHLLFSALPDGTRADALPVLDAHLAARPAASHRSEAHVGWLPVLRIGLVVRAGVWPDSAVLRRLVAAGGGSGIGACAAWRHLRLDPLKPEEGSRPEADIPEGLGPLSTDAALAEIRKVLSR